MMQQDEGAPVAQAATKGGRLRTVMTVLIVIVALALGFTVGFVGFGYYATQQAQRPAEVAQAFCADLLGKRYDAAFGLLSGPQQQGGKAAYVRTAGLHDQIDGPVTGCVVTDAAAGMFTLRLINSKTVTMRIQRRKAVSGAVTLTKQGGDWQVASIAQTLQGTDVGPLLVGMAFCADLVAKDYTAAYGELSSGEQAAGDEKAFAASFGSAFGGVETLSACTPNIKTYKVAGNDRVATMNVVFGVTFQVGKRTTVTIPATLSVVRQQAGWKVDSIVIAAGA